MDLGEHPTNPSHFWQIFGVTGLNGSSDTIVGHDPGSRLPRGRKGGRDEDSILKQEGMSGCSRRDPPQDDTPLMSGKGVMTTPDLISHTLTQSVSTVGLLGFFFKCNLLDQLE